MAAYKQSYKVHNLEEPDLDAERAKVNKFSPDQPQEKTCWGSLLASALLKHMSSKSWLLHQLHFKFCEHWDRDNISSQLGSWLVWNSRRAEASRDILRPYLGNPCEDWRGEARRRKKIETRIDGLALQREVAMKAMRIWKPLKLENGKGCRVGSVGIYLTSNRNSFGIGAMQIEECSADTKRQAREPWHVYGMKRNVSGPLETWPKKKKNRTIRYDKNTTSLSGLQN